MSTKQILRFPTDFALSNTQPGNRYLLKRPHTFMQGPYYCPVTDIPDDDPNPCETIKPAVSEAGLCIMSLNSSIADQVHSLSGSGKCALPAHGRKTPSPIAQSGYSHLPTPPAIQMKHPCPLPAYLQSPSSLHPSGSSGHR